MFDKMKSEKEFRRIVKINMNDWADGTDDIRSQRAKRGESSMKMGSNYEGKLLEEEIDAKTNAVGVSSGTKEGSPLRGFSESPSQLVAAIRSKADASTKIGTLRNHIEAAFTEQAFDDRLANEFPRTKNRGGALEAFRSKIKGAK
jgi:hypothetical protein